MKYIHETGELFEAVQMQGIFPDGKTFPDCLPKSDLPAIVSRFEQEENQPGFDLKKFVEKHFTEPPTVGSGFVSDTARPPEQHIHALWDVLTRQPDAGQVQGSLLPLPHPFVVPGGRFREVYYWDSYFTMLGLRASGRWDLIENMVENFAYLIARYGFIPNGNRSYYLGRSQPPFFSLMVKLLSEEKGEAVLVKNAYRLKAEYVFWMAGVDTLKEEYAAHRRVVNLPGGTFLNRYWDRYETPRPESYREDVELSNQSAQPAAQLYRNLRAAAESGWDFSSRWLNDQNEFASIRTTDIVPVDLNCLLVHLEEMVAAACRLNGDFDRAENLQQAATRRRAAILAYCWDEEEGFFFDFNFVKKKRTAKRTLAAAFPLFFNIATQPQAEKVAVLLERDFLKPGGLTTTLDHTGQQWDAPNGWAPLQWMAYFGLKNYGLTALADKVKTAWLNTNRRVYEQTGKMTEKYDVFNENAGAGGGEYPNQDGFGWTNGVFLGMRYEG
ncbi:MAG: alpha,alpha-trehalase TreF [Bacteroidetes bacterium]|nr:alpha,alpha-trehalase TreF [Bacteroidota bacterium]